MSILFRKPHLDPAQWHKPEEFIPERFDIDSPYFLTPDGKTRSPVSYLPFSLGSRSCLGQTLGLAELRALFAFYIVNGKYTVVNEDVLTEPGAFFGITTPHKLICRLTSFKD